MNENIVRLKATLEERERVWQKTQNDYQHYKKNPPYTPDGNVVALEMNVANLFSSASELIKGYQEYLAALENELAIGKQ